MMWRTFCTLLITAVTLIHIAEAQQEPIYVPFAWNNVPATATPISVAGSTTTFILLEGSGRRATPGPATLVQGPSAASMTYVAPTATLSGVCNLRSPIAICTLNVYETGAVFPSTGIPGRSTATAKEGSSTGRSLLGSATSSLLGGYVLALGTAVLGFAISVALIR